MASSATDTCGHCAKTLETLKKTLSVLPSALYLHVDTNIINQPLGKIDKKERKKNRSHLQRSLRRKVSALRNSLGGYLLIHFHGLQKNDRYAGSFDELVDDDLNSMIDDALFSNVYFKFWLEDITQNHIHKNFLVLEVEPSVPICIAQTNTKQALEFSIIELSRPNLEFMKCELRENKSSTEPDPEATEINNIRIDWSKLHECQNVQLKSFEKPIDNLDNLAKYIWTELRLKEYISAFTKLKPRNQIGGESGGGRYFLGVKEKDSFTSSYISRAIDVQGIQLTSRQCDGLTKKLLSQREKLLVCDESGNELPSDGIFNVLYHPCPDRGDRVVLEIRVKYIEGFVFYDQAGPRACRIQDNEVMDITVKDIFLLMTKHMN